mmetsp:Transcript_29519/g.82473  ORF Transcript_29519/g.82473 Transcript_29519/m.82473 type:complete len:218 (-) Transcript_29519:1126-1779(-)
MIRRGDSVLGNGRKVSGEIVGERHIIHAKVLEKLPVRRLNLYEALLLVLLNDGGAVEKDIDKAWGLVVLAPDESGKRGVRGDVRAVNEEGADSLDDFPHAKPLGDALLHAGQEGGPIGPPRRGQGVEEGGETATKAEDDAKHEGAGQQLQEPRKEVETLAVADHRRNDLVPCTQHRFILTDRDGAEAEQPLHHREELLVLPVELLVVLALEEQANVL